MRSCSFLGELEVCRPAATSPLHAPPCALSFLNAGIVRLLPFSFWVDYLSSGQMLTTQIWSPKWLQ